ncbi:putative NBD/HSP70 family sugar kinase [Silvibacterium bohemicum]|uniref:Putative NBD/HSP70 family sugar kinase n=1 Tax=Silvibacterium bohemicum TaxID=1577686 RepID=A0A841K2Q5_9BACT|nr:ROK family protein [Silvibacterium bohemicum]MBB6145441.1 putative NBD/HSP70 family sugar kinase [Silvibacterium bohemicum]
MARTVGVTMTDRVVAGLIDDHKISGELLRYPLAGAVIDGQADEMDSLIEMPADGLCELICDKIAQLVPAGSQVEAVGVAMPGIIRNGIIEDSPNLPQLKGAHVEEAVRTGLAARNLVSPVTILNDADAAAAGLAATRGQLDRLVRVWTIGNGIGFGRFPYTEGPWEGGHMVVTLDPKENYCACGGRGHLEGIMGHRAMRLRFLDLEPDEVFEHARKGDKRCQDFVERWHLGVAAATASQIHLEGPGRFYFTGRNIQRLDLSRLKDHLYQMVKMSPLQSYTLEVLPEDPTLAVIGAAAAAEHASKGC